jgi:hypothetical protein
MPFLSSILLLLTQAALSSSGEITRERLDAAFADARAAVEKTLEARLPEDLTVQVVEPEEIAARVADENLPSLLRQFPDPETARAQAQVLGEAFAQIAFAKYAWSTSELLVAPSTWTALAAQLERPALTGDGALRAVMVHELVHALDDAAFDLGASIERLDNPDAIAAFNAVIEGHAQLEARRVCVQAGWTEGFECFTESIGALPPSAEEQGEAELLLLRLQIDTVATAYYEGERFVAAIQAAGGPEAVARAFRDPPRDGETIFHPEWFLDEKLRPAVRYDLESPLDLFAERFASDAWLTSRQSIQPAQLEAALALLPRESIQRIQSTLRGNRTFVAQPRQAPASKLVVLAVMEFDAEESARFYLEAVRQLGLLKDEVMKTGEIRIVESEYADLDLPSGQGLLQRKRMQVGPQTVEVASVSAVRGRTVVETIFSNEPIEDSAHRELAGTLLEALRKVEKAGEER